MFLSNTFRFLVILDGQFVSFRIQLLYFQGVKSVAIYCFDVTNICIAHFYYRDSSRNVNDYERQVIKCGPYWEGISAYIRLYP